MVKITVSRSGNTLTVTGGNRTGQASYDTISAAKGQETRLRNDAAYAARWLRTYEPAELGLPEDIARRVAMMPASENSMGTDQMTGGLIDDEK